MFISNIINSFRNCSNIFFVLTENLQKFTFCSDEVNKSLEKKNGEYGEIVGKLLNTELVLTQIKNNLETVTNQLQTKEAEISGLKQQLAQSQSSSG